LRRRADEEFATLSASAREALHRVLPAIVRLDPTDERLIVESRVPRAQFAGDSPSQALIDAFVNAHLLVADRAPDGTPVIGLAHEALLREWPPANEWIEQNRERLRLRAGIAAAAALWRDSLLSSDRLLAGTLLRDARGLLANSPHMLGSAEQEFVELSQEKDRESRRRRIVRSSSLAVGIALAVLLPTIGLGKLEYAVSVSRALTTIWSSDSPVPVSERARVNLKNNIDTLARDLKTQIGNMGRNPEFNSWAVAQTWVALHGPDQSLPAKAGELRAFMTAQRDSQCSCWRETEDKLPHTVATAWVLYALALYDQPAEPAEIASLVARQGAEGWWSMFPATRDPGNASTAATAWAALALHTQLAHRLIEPPQLEAADAAVRKAVAWLRSRPLPGQARWTEYAPDHTAEQRQDYLAVSALVVQVLRAVAGVREFDQQWLAELPQRVPALNENEIAKGQVFMSKSQFTLDDSRHYPYPWMLSTTVKTFSRGSDLEKARALIWINTALANRLTSADFHNEYWTIAETLFSFRRIASQLKIQQSS
jgi:hypothetical protein